MASWSEVELGEVCDVTMGQAPKGDTYNDRGEGLPLVAGAGDFGELHPEPKKYTNASALRSSLCGDIIIAIRASIGNKVLSDRAYCLGRGVAGLRPKPELDERFLWHWLDHVAPVLASKGRGATFLQVNKRDVNELEMALPPIEEQRRISAVLDAADELRTKRRQAIAKLDTLTQAIFFDMFGDPLSGAQWVVRPLGEVVRSDTSVTYGIVQAGPEVSDGVPYIRTGDIKAGRIIESGLRRTSPEVADRFPRSRVETGEIVMSIRATVGTTAMVEPNLDGANLTQGTARISPGDEVTSAFLLALLRSSPIQHWIERQVKGATFREITLTRLRELPVALPPLSLQREFAARCDNVERVRSEAARTCLEMEALFAALQQHAFRGEL